LIRTQIEGHAPGPIAGDLAHLGQGKSLPYWGQSARTHVPTRVVDSATLTQQNFTRLNLGSTSTHACSRSPQTQSPVAPVRLESGCLRLLMLSLQVCAESGAMSASNDDPTCQLHDKTPFRHCERSNDWGIEKSVKPLTAGTTVGTTAGKNIRVWSME
jgi:hypothetical protein